MIIEFIVLGMIAYFEYVIVLTAKIFGQSVHQDVVYLVSTGDCARGRAPSSLRPTREEL